MSLTVFNGLMFGLFVSMAAMVVVRFAFYRRKDHPMGAVYFWGGCLFFSLTVADLISRYAYGNEGNDSSIIITFLLGVWTLYQAVKKRRLVSSMNV